MYRPPSYFPIGVNMYVPAMQGSAEFSSLQPVPFSLGKPAAASASAATGASPVAGNTAVGTVTGLVYTADSPYGRTLVVTPSGDPGAAGAILDVFGTDYLGQQMVERFTGTSGSTAALYGKKAFGRVTRAVVNGQASNAITWAIGTGTRLGLPYKTDLVSAKEGGAWVNTFKRPTTVTVDRSAAQATAGGSVFVQAPVGGYITQVRGWAGSGGGGANPAITIKLGGVAITGLSCTIPESTPGVPGVGTPSTAGYNANNRVIAGQAIEVVGSAAAGAGSDTVEVTISPSQYQTGDMTDPATNSTGDPRGTYEGLGTYNSVNEIIVYLNPDASVSAAGNGGLMGIRQALS